ncbi:MAG: molybdopterin-dependent oxidoreductase [Polyangiaceae bacterium]
MTRRTSLTSCRLCEATCGLVVEHDDELVYAVRGDEDDIHSGGYLCPKAVGTGDVQADPDRIRQPQLRTATGWTPIGWDEALEWAGGRIAALQAAHGRDAVGWYHGNPTGHSSSAILYAVLLTEVLGTKQRFSSTSVDSLPRVLASYLMYGNQGVIPVPDVDRTDMMLVLGANPVVSQGSAWSVPFVKKRLKALAARGRLVVVDPARTQTAALATEHLAIRPGMDAPLLASMLRTILVEGLAQPNRWATAAQLAGLGEAVAPYTPQRVARGCGIAATTIEAVARDFAGAERAVAYGRMGISTQAHGTLATCLIDTLNAVTGNLDRAGGAMFTTPAIDLPAVAARLGQRGSFDDYRSRVRGLPEFNRELPVVTLVDEIETPGPGQIRGMVIHAGNPVLSVPEGPRLGEALASLDLLIAIDIYRNETTRHAHLILPPSFGFEASGYPVIALGLAARNVTKLVPAIMPGPRGVRPDWQIMLGLAEHILAHRGRAGRVASRALSWAAHRGPDAVLRLAVRLGPHGLRGRGLTWDRIGDSPHGIDLGPLEPRLADVIQTDSGGVVLLPDTVREDLAGLEESLDRDESLTLISRRSLRSNNSWMHNCSRLTKGATRCTLQMHPDDAKHRGIDHGATVDVRSETGTVRVPVEVTTDVIPGVVSMPHGWGHHREGTELRAAAERPGESINDVTTTRSIDRVSGCASFADDVDVRLASPDGHEQRT